MPKIATTEELNDSTAPGFIKRLVYPRLDDNITPNPFGRQFRESIESFHPDGPNGKLGWKRPSQTYGIAVDQIIHVLIKKNTQPRIDPLNAQHAGSLKYSGPYDFARSHLWHCAMSFPDFQEEEAYALAERSRIDLIDDAVSALMRVREVPFWDFGRRTSLNEKSSRVLTEDEWYRENDKLTHTQKAIVSHQGTLEEAVKSLWKLREITEDELSRIWKNGPGTGRPRQLWKLYFVRSMAQLWWHLTRTKPSTDSMSLFAEFVELCWYSFDERMPAVSFTRAIQTHRS